VTAIWIKWQSTGNLLTYRQYTTDCGLCVVDFIDLTGL
jgi:hypothetical protein